MVDLSCTYLGLELSNPLVIGASPLTRDLSMAKELEEAGAAAIVLPSLFEEQLVQEELAFWNCVEPGDLASADGVSYLPQGQSFEMGSSDYLEYIEELKSHLKIPVIASLNGRQNGDWMYYCRLMEERGADAIELNVYTVPSNPDESPEFLEKQLISMVKSLKKVLEIPLSVKLSPFYTSLANFGSRLSQAGSRGLVIFNRFYQPNIDIDERKVIHSINLSNNSELLLRLRWLAILYGRIDGSLALTGGVQTTRDIIKGIMCGADCIQVVSSVLRDGPGFISQRLKELEEWLEEKGCKSVKEMCGTMSHRHCPDPDAFERAQYMAILQSWRGKKGS
ncbi:MAG: dihydroorotate dehydrogenase-like protein [Planctomycetota bacterium]|nr:dihydroorotate dehydrogenase-like protein [Planctomycetota bacterium]